MSTALRPDHSDLMGHLPLVSVLESESESSHTVTYRLLADITDMHTVNIRLLT